MSVLLEIDVFGKPRLCVAGQAIAIHKKPKVFELIAYLIVHGGAATKAELRRDVWEGFRGPMDTMFSQIRKSQEDGSWTAWSQVLSRIHIDQEVSIELEGIQCDYLRYRQAGRSGNALQLLTLYKGVLLDDGPYAWCERVRRRIEEEVAGALDDLCRGSQEVPPAFNSQVVFANILEGYTSKSAIGRLVQPEGANLAGNLLKAISQLDSYESFRTATKRLNASALRHNVTMAESVRGVIEEIVDQERANSEVAFPDFLLPGFDLRYVKPSGFDALYEKGKKDRLLLLSGAPGSGKERATMEMLKRRFHRDAPPEWRARQAPPAVEVDLRFVHLDIWYMRIFSVLCATDDIVHAPFFRLAGRIGGQCAYLLLRLPDKINEAHLAKLRKLLSCCPGLHILATTTDRHHSRELCDPVPTLSEPTEKECENLSALKAQRFGCFRLFLRGARRLNATLVVQDEDVRRYAKHLLGARAQDIVSLGELAAALPSERWLELVERVGVGPLQRDNLPDAVREPLERSATFHWKFRYQSFERVCQGLLEDVEDSWLVLQRAIDLHVLRLDGRKYEFVDRLQRTALRRQAETAPWSEQMPKAFADAMVLEVSLDTNAELEVRFRDGFADVEKALTYCIQYGMQNEGLAIATRFASLWYIQGRLREGHFYLEKLIQDRNDPSVATVNAWHVLGNLDLQQRNFELTEMAYRQARLLSERLGSDGSPNASDRHLTLARVFVGMGNFESETSCYAAAREYYEKAKELLADTYPEKVNSINLNLAIVSIDEGRPELAIDVLKGYLELDLDLEQQGALLQNLSIALNQNLCADEAEECVRKSLMLREEGQGINYANSLLALADILILKVEEGHEPRERLSEACEICRRALAIGAEQGAQLVGGHLHLSRALLLRGRRQEAQASLLTCLRLPAAHEKGRASLCLGVAVETALAVGNAEAAAILSGGRARHRPNPFICKQEQGQVARSEKAIELLLNSHMSALYDQGMNMAMPDLWKLAIGVCEAS